MANGAYYVDQALTNISQAYRNADDSFKAELLLPVVSVQKKTGKYWQYDRNNLKKPVSTLRTGRALTQEATFSKFLQNYGPLEEHALKDFITKDEYEMEDNPLNVEIDTVNFLNDQMNIDKEVNAATLLNNTSVITQNSAVGTQWNASTGAGTPFTDIETGVGQMKLYGLHAPNTMWMSYPVWSQLKNHPDLLDRVKYSQLGALTTETFLSLFPDSGISKIVICDAVYDTQPEGVAATNNYIWPKNFGLGYINPNPTLRSMNSGFTLQLQNGKYVDRKDEFDPKGSWIRNNDYYQQFIVGAEGYYLLTSVVA